MKNRRYVLAAIVLAAAFVRLAGIGFGLPHTETRPDESTIVFLSLRFAVEGFSPPSLIYPTFFTYALAAVYKIYGFFAGGLLTQYVRDPANFFMLSRLLAVFLGILTVWPVYKTAKEFFDETTALVSAFFLAFCYLHVRDSHFGALDVPMTFFIAWSSFFLARSFNSGKAKDYALAGVFAGLAAGTKYAGILLAFQLFAVHLLNLRREQKNLKNFPDKRFWLFVFCLAAAFIITTPYALLNFRQLAADYRYHTALHGVMRGNAWLYHLDFSLLRGLGWPVFLAALAGTALLAKLDFKKLAALGTFAAVYFMVISKVNSTFARYAVPLIPFFCVSAAYFTVSAARRFFKFPAAVAVLAALLVLPSAAAIFRFDRLISKTDSRVIAAEILTRLPDGTPVCIAAGDYAAPQIPWNAEHLDAKISQSLSEKNLFKIKILEEMKALRAKTGFRKINFGSGGFSDDSGKPAKPDFVILAVTPVKNLVFPGLSEELKKNYVLVGSVEAFNPSAQNRYDESDEFYVPFSGFKDTVRPGPNIYIFRKAREKK